MNKKNKQKFQIPYTNRKAIKLLSESGQNSEQKVSSDLSYLSENQKLLLQSWGLPASVVRKYHSKGVESLFPWQLECLSNPKVLSGTNLLYSAPTSAGKTLVAEILMIKQVLELGKKAIFILPFVSVAREKMYSLQELFGDVGVRVEGFMGSYNPPGGFKAVDIAICTIEKANSLINRLLEEDSLSQVGTIVVDELHLVGDPNRGYLLELLLTKIRFMCKTRASIGEQQHSEYNDEDGPKSKKLNIQIIGMSATLPNLNLLAQWLDSELVISDYRPVPLIELIKLGDSIYDQQLNVVRPVQNESLAVSLDKDKEDIIYLSLETVLYGHSVLIFCPTKMDCEKLAVKIAYSFFSIGSNKIDPPNPAVSEKLRNQLCEARLNEVVMQLKQCPAGLDENLKNTVKYAVAFHHAGLTYDERDILEASFKRCVLRVIVATSTLSAGVNLPARRVIISTPFFNGNPLDVLTYRQMSGRAGRKGVDTKGESILICNSTLGEMGKKLVQSALPAVTSALVDKDGSASSMKRAVLEVVASNIATTSDDVQQYTNCSLLSLTLELTEKDGISISSHVGQDTAIQECLKYLEEKEFVRLQHSESEGKEKYMPTQLGSACLASSLSPSEGIAVFKELQKARQCFVLDNDLHTIYQVTPIYLSQQWRNLINWHLYLELWDKLSAGERKVGQLVGVDSSFIINAMMGSVSWKTTNQQKLEALQVHQRFFTALALNDLVHEMSMSQVVTKYGANKGVIQNLQQAASTFAGMVTAFCGRLGWSSLELLLSQFQDRLQFGVQRELCDLVRLSLLNGKLARILYDNNIKSVSDLAASDPMNIEGILHRAGPFQSVVHGVSTALQTNAIWVLGNSEAKNESEAAKLIVEEARQFIKMELGLSSNVDLGWNKQDTMTEDKENEQSINYSTKSKKDENLNDEESDDSNSDNNILYESHESLNELEQESSAVSDNMFETSQQITNGIEDNESENFSSEELFKNTEKQNVEENKEEIDVADVFEQSLNISCPDHTLVKHSTPKHKINEDDSQEIPLLDINSISQVVDPMDVTLSGEGQNATSEQKDGTLDMELSSLMETSLNISNNNEDEVVDEQKQNSRKNSRFLTDSETVAMMAMVEGDSNFESQDMFEEEEEEEEKQKSLQIREESFVNSHESSQCEIIDGKLIKVRRILAAEFIPENMFNSETLVAVTLKLVPPKRSSSMAHFGIGSRIIQTAIDSKLKKVSNESDESEHCISLYNGGDTIWIFSWNHTQNGNQRYPFLNTEGKVGDIFQRFKSSSCTLVLFDLKQKLKKLVKYCGRQILQRLPKKLLDPKIAQWMCHFDDENNNVILSWDKLISTHLRAEERRILQFGWEKEAAEAYLLWKLMSVLKQQLITCQLWNHFLSTEMPCMIPLLLIELNGFGLDSAHLDKLKHVLQFKSAMLELKAFEIAGKQFNISSPREIEQILFREIGLKRPRGTTGTGSEKVLSKLDHDLAHIIIEWRKVSNALSSVVTPFQQERNLESGRIHGHFSHFTQTGRIVQNDPSLQIVPRDFDLHVAFNHKEVMEIRNTCKIKFGSKLSSLLNKVEIGYKNLIESCGILQYQKQNWNTISMRNVFVPSSSDFTLLSADYAQLELRILAHLCQDPYLLEVLNQNDTDVFIAIASAQKKIPYEEITSEMRREAKAVTYGIIYGMGSRALAEQLDIELNQAATFILSFMKTFPKIRNFLEETIKTTREKGYTETLSGRRRYLPHINSSDSGLKAKAERQAVNSRIQGTASDLVKIAMIKIQNDLLSIAPDSSLPVEWSKRGNSTANDFLDKVICFPILSLHDELIYEVRKSLVSQIATLIRSAMESCVNLSVRLPVVIKCGKSWGSLQPYDL